jgi:branched-chain amino acid transport system substrate-binding protein
MEETMKKLLAGLTAAALVCGPAYADSQGVSADSVKLGSYTDLSGPLAVWGVPSANGMRMRIDEANAAGGVHGRQIELLIEDMQYQVPRAVQAANKLVRHDKVFAMLGALGTPQNLAVMPQQLKAGVPNMYPLTGSKVMTDPVNPMVFSFFRSYYEQFRAAAAHFHDNGGYTTPCVAQVANDAGEEMTHGVEDQLAVYGMKIAAKTEHAATETDLTSSVITLKNAGCDIVFLATSVRDTIITVATAKKLGFEPIFVTGMVPYMDAVAGAAGGAMQDLYLVSPFVYKNAANAEGESKRILDAYQAEHGKAMEPQAQLGYIFADLTIKALEAAGPDLSVESFLAATESIKEYSDPIGGQVVSFSADDHQGADEFIMARVNNSAWEVVVRGLDY